MTRWARRDLLTAAMAATALLPLPAIAQQEQSATTRPNIVVFLADDLSFEDLSIAGDRNARTPNIAALAQGGMSFDRAYVASPSCAPSRAALLTGMMPARNGAEANHQRPDASIRKLPSYLQELGYEVVAFGKVAHYEYTGTFGFDHYAHDTYHDDRAIPAAARWLKARKDKRPLALFVGSNWPHVPWPVSTDGFEPAKLTLPPKSVDTPEARQMRARYYAAVARLDQELGDTLAVADEVLGKDTFVLFSSDHGAQWPFRKWNLYETGTQVPMIVRWRGQVQAGVRTDAMVSWVDILPTLTEVAGGKTPQGIDGRSFAQAWRSGGSFEGRAEIFTTHNNDGNINVYPGRAVRTDRWKYIENLHPEWVHTTHIDQRPGPNSYFETWRRAAATDPAAKAVVDAYYKRPGEELYDLSADPHEQHNLAGNPRHASTLKAMRARLKAWRSEQGDDRPIRGTPHRAIDPVRSPGPSE